MSSHMHSTWKSCRHMGKHAVSISESGTAGQARQLIRGNSVPELVRRTGPEPRVRGPVSFLVCRGKAGI